MLFMFDFGSTAAATAPKLPSSHSNEAGHDMCIFAPLASLKPKLNGQPGHLLEAPNINGKITR